MMFIISYYVSLMPFNPTTVGLWAFARECLPMFALFECNFSRQYLHARYIPNSSSDYNCYLLLDLVKLPIVIEVNAIIVMQPNDVDVIVSFGQTTQCNWIIATRRYITGRSFETCRFCKYRKSQCKFTHSLKPLHTIHIDM